MWVSLFSSIMWYPFVARHPNQLGPWSSDEQQRPSLVLCEFGLLRALKLDPDILATVVCVSSFCVFLSHPVLDGALVEFVAMLLWLPALVANF